MPDLIPASSHGAAIGLDHVGIVAADLDSLARDFSEHGFHLTPVAMHASGRTANRSVMLRDGGYLELMATVPGRESATLDRFLARGTGAHILALEVADEVAALERLRAGGITAEASVTERDAGDGNAKARFALIMPPDMPDGRVLLIRHLTRELLWRPENTVHANRSAALTEIVYALATQAGTMTRLSRLAGRPAEPDPLGGFRVPLARGCIRVLPRPAALSLFPGADGHLPLIGLTLSADAPGGQVIHAGGVSIRFTALPG